jgi:hypothetical protein
MDHRTEDTTICPLSGDELELVTGGGRIVDGILLGAYRAGLFVPSNNVLGSYQCKK